MFESIGKIVEVAETAAKEVAANVEKIVPESGISLKEADEYWNKFFAPKNNIEKKSTDSFSNNYYDDNNEVYRKGNDLVPNHDYEINGYKYHTDEIGRISSAEGNLHLKDREGRLPIKDSIENIGKGYELPNDDRGHLIADQFGGSNGLENLIPQDAEVNRKDFMNFENKLANEVKNGNEVYIKNEPNYEGNSRRPSEFIVTYSVNGTENIRIFPNGKEINK